MNIYELSTPSLGITRRLGERKYSAELFQLPLSGSPGRTDDGRVVLICLEHLSTPSLGITTYRGTNIDALETFNSLSRDHGTFRRCEIASRTVIFQLPLSGSLAGKRIHAAHHVFQLPLSGSRDPRRDANEDYF